MGFVLTTNPPLCRSFHVWMAGFQMVHMCYMIWNVLGIVMPVECKEVDTFFLEKQDAKVS